MSLKILCVWHLLIYLFTYLSIYLPIICIFLKWRGETVKNVFNLAFACPSMHQCFRSGRFCTCLKHRMFKAYYYFSSSAHNMFWCSCSNKLYDSLYLSHDKCSSLSRKWKLTAVLHHLKILSSLCLWTHLQWSPPMSFDKKIHLKMNL